jgi:hypothetical protein
VLVACLFFSFYSRFAYTTVDYSTAILLALKHQTGDKFGTMVDPQRYGYVDELETHSSRGVFCATGKKKFSNNAATSPKSIRRNSLD